MTEASPDPKVREKEFQELLRAGQSGLDRKRPLSVNAAPKVIPSTKESI